MSEERKPETLRDTIRHGLANHWTQQLEDDLFWPISEFMVRACDIAYDRGKSETLDHLQQAGVLPLK